MQQLFIKKCKTTKKQTILSQQTVLTFSICSVLLKLSSERTFAALEQIIIVSRKQTKRSYLFWKSRAILGQDWLHL